MAALRVSTTGALVIEPCEPVIITWQLSLPGVLPAVKETDAPVASGTFVKPAPGIPRHW